MQPEHETQQKMFVICLYAPMHHHHSVLPLFSKWLQFPAMSNEKSLKSLYLRRKRGNHTCIIFLKHYRSVIGNIHLDCCGCKHLRVGLGAEDASSGRLFQSTMPMVRRKWWNFLKSALQYGTGWRERMAVLGVSLPSWLIMIQICCWWWSDHGGTFGSLQVWHILYLDCRDSQSSAVTVSALIYIYMHHPH